MNGEGEWRVGKVAAHNLVKSFGTGELMQAEQVIIDYYEALASDNPELAFDLLTTEAQEQTSPRELSSGVDGLEKLAATTLQPVQGSADQLIYYVRMLAAPGDGPSAEGRQQWRAGENAPWLTVVHDGDDWRIAQTINSAILTEVTSWQRVSVPPINMTLDVPAGWTRAGL